MTAWSDKILGGDLGWVGIVFRTIRNGLASDSSDYELVQILVSDDLL